MTELKTRTALIVGLSILLGMASLGYLLSSAALQIKQFERTVTAKGLSERELAADTVIWPIQFSAASNELEPLYDTVAANSEIIRKFLLDNGVGAEDITTGAPSITDKSAQQYGGSGPVPFRYTALQTLTVYSRDVALIRELAGRLLELGRKGIVFSGADHQGSTEYLFTRLNEIKPEMIEEATRNARQVAEEFAADSQSRLGKIKRASQGQFSIQPRDRYTPHIKKIRVVSTVEYYLTD